MKVHWTKHALIQLIDIFEFISIDSKFFAKKTIDEITNSSLYLKSYPELGRIVPEINQDEIREIIHKNYRIIYLVGKNQIDILSLIHCAQDFNKHFNLDNQ